MNPNNYKIHLTAVARRLRYFADRIEKLSNIKNSKENKALTRVLFAALDFCVKIVNKNLTKNKNNL